MTRIDAITRLTQGIKDRCPNLGISVGVLGQNDSVSFTPSPSATQAQIGAAQAFINSFDWQDYQTLPLYQIFAALAALTTVQQTEVAADLFAGNPLKVLTDPGPNAAAIVVLYYITQLTVLPVASINLAKLYAACMYVQDNPTYLINPAFDTAINVPGWGPVS
jgi:hypothetical protein